MITANFTHIIKYISPVKSLHFCDKLQNVIIWEGHIMQQPLAMHLLVVCPMHYNAIHCMGQNIKSLAARVCVSALTSGPLWGSACVYHGLVGRA